jgi:hypothetical protein
MRKIITCALAIAALFAAACQRTAVDPPRLLTADAPGAACNQSQGENLNIAEIRQTGTNWCWAASGEMVMSHYDRRVPQCEQVNKSYGLTHCCGDLVEPECDLTGWPDFARYDFDFKRTKDAALSWEQIKEQIACKNNPIAFSWKWVGNSGHMMVIKGFQVVDGVNYLYVNDPSKNPAHRFIKYDFYVQSANNHTHWDDFYDFKKRGGS